MFCLGLVSFEAKKWWKVMGHKAEKNDVLNADFCKFLESLHSLTSTSASIERMSSTFGLVCVAVAYQKEHS